MTDAVKDQAEDTTPGIDSEKPPADDTDDTGGSSQDSGDEKQFTQADLNRLIGKTRAEEREKAQQEALEQKNKDADAAKKKALIDEGKLKELTETQATEIVQKDTRIKELEERLTKLVDTDLEGLPQPLKDLRERMNVEEWADYRSKNQDLFSGTGKAAGSPASPTPPPGAGKLDEAERRKKAVSVRSYW